VEVLEPPPQAASAPDVPIAPIPLRTSRRFLFIEFIFIPYGGAAII
jgi:hypothetical protein